MRRMSVILLVLALSAVLLAGCGGIGGRRTGWERQGTKPADPVPEPGAIIEVPLELEEFEQLLAELESSEFDEDLDLDLGLDSLGNLFD